MKRITSIIREELSQCYSTDEIAALTRIIATELLGVSQMAFYLKDDIPLTAEQQAMLENAIERLKKQVKEQRIKEPSDCKQLLIESIKEQMKVEVNGRYCITEPMSVADAHELAEHIRKTDPAAFFAGIAE